MLNQIETIIKESILIKKQILGDTKIKNIISKSVSIILGALKRGNKLYFCGNGGSAADAQHLAAEFTGRFYLDRTALPAEALHCNSSYMTAVANDYSFEDVYSRLLDGVSKPGDVLIGLSTSGNSKNIIKALQTAKSNKLHTISLTGLNGGLMKNYSDYLLDVPSENTPRIQECHILIGHIICQMVEENFFKS
jgi:D-sedoheptulose 7-phosphate isomerase